MYDVLIVILSVIGFLIAFHIYHKKHEAHKMVCVVGKKCDVVLASKYKKTFGLGNEVLGMIYYFVIFVMGLWFIFGEDNVAGFSLEALLIILGVIGVLFSVYLTYLQFFVLKSICDYCIGSAIVTFLILIAELF
jgi:uncharacterized membrane protein